MIGLADQPAASSCGPSVCEWWWQNLSRAPLFVQVTRDVWQHRSQASTGGRPTG